MAISPRDGRIALTFIDEQATPRRIRAAVISPEGGPPIKVFEVPNIFGMIGPAPFAQVIELTADGGAFTYLETKAGVSNIWSQPVDGSPAKQLTNFKSDLIFFYSWSPDGKKLALARGKKISDVVLIRDITNAQ